MGCGLRLTRQTEGDTIGGKGDGRRFSFVLLSGLYRVEDRIAEQGATTYRGFVEASKHPVFVHLIPPDAPTDDKVKILQRLKHRMASGSNGLLDIGHEGAQWYAITEVIADFSGFVDWLNREAAESMRPPLTNTVDRAIKNFEWETLQADAPIPQHAEQSDPVAEMFARPNAATDMRGQRQTQDHERETYSPSGVAGPSLYTRVVEPDRRATDASAAVAPNAAEAKAPCQPDSGGQSARIAVLESQLAIWKTGAIAAFAIAILCLFIVFVALMRAK